MNKDLRIKQLISKLKQNNSVMLTKEEINNEEFTEQFFFQVAINIPELKLQSVCEFEEEVLVLFNKKQKNKTLI